MKAVLLLSLGLLAAGAAHAAEFQARVPASGRERAAMPVSLSGPVAPLQRLLGLPGKPEGLRLSVLEEGSEVPAQVDLRGGEATFAWIAPGTTAPGRERVFTLRLEPGRPEAAKASGVTVTEAPEAITVETPYLRVSHPRAWNGGLPAAITFLPEGGSFDRVNYGDRVWDQNANRGYHLRHDRRPQVSVEAAGPARVVVRVRARYVDPQGQAPESAPYAVYRFIYSPASPTFRVEAVVDQEKPAPWSQLHFLEWNFKHDFFTKWALASGPEAIPTLKEFGATKQSQTAAGWGALLNDRVALAMAAGHHVVYDDRDGYGRYLHGPWIADWDGRRRTLAATIYAGPAGATPEALSQAVAPHLPDGAAAAVTVRVPSLEARLSKQAARLNRDDVMGRWLLRLAAGAAHDPASLEDASRLLARIEARAATASPSTSAPVRRPLTPSPPHPLTAAPVLVEEMPGLILATDGVLGVGFRKEGEGWRLFSLYHTGADHEFLESLSAPAALWQARVVLPDRKTSRALAGGPASLTVDRSKSPKEVVLRLSWPGELPVIASIVLRAGTGLSAWRAAAGRPAGGGGVWEFDFPVLAGLGSREHPERDTLAVPRSWGVLYPNPKATLTRTGADYPSGAWSMQYALLYHGDAGLYLGTHDPRASAKRFAVAYQGDAAGGAIAYTVTHCPPNMGLPGTACAPDYDTVIGVYRGDWYEGSRLYRQWAQSAPWLAKGTLAKRRDVGGAIRPLALWMLASGASGDVVPKVKEFQEFFSVPMGVHWYNWHQIPFDNDYPHYFPAKPGFKEGVAELTGRGVVVMPYINGRLWDTDTDDWEAAKPFAAMKPEGENYVEEYGSKQKLAPMCPTTPLWQGKMKETVLSLVRDYGVSGVYLDQITAARPALCFNAAHGHPLGGGDHWWTGYRKLLGDIRSELARTHPSAFLTSENNAEPWIDLLEGHLTWVPALGRLAPMYGVVYGGYTYPYGRQTSAADLEDRHAAAMKFATQFLWGGQLGWLDAGILNPKYRPEAEYLRRLAQARAQLIPYLAEGEMRKPPRILSTVPALTGKTVYYSSPVEDTMPAVLTAAWRAADGSVAFLLTNMSPEAQTFTWELDLVGCGLGTGAVLSRPGETTGERLAGLKATREETLPGRDVRAYVARPAK